MDTDGMALFIRVYQRESVVRFLWLRLAALCSFAANMEKGHKSGLAELERLHDKLTAGGR